MCLPKLFQAQNISTNGVQFIYFYLIAFDLKLYLIFN